MDLELYGSIVVDNQNINTDKLFTYKIPRNLERSVKEGARVLVPFGKSNRLIEGVLLKLEYRECAGVRNVKEIEYVVDSEPVMSQETIELVHWIKERYLAKYIDVVRTILPTGLNVKSSKYVVLIKKIEFEDDNPVHQYINHRKRISLDTLTKKFKSDNLKDTINGLVADGYIRIDQVLKQEVNKAYEKIVCKSFREDVGQILESLSSRAKKQKEVISFIDKENRVPLKDLLAKLNASTAIISSLEAKGLVEVVEVEVNREPIKREIEPYHKFTLNDEQLAVYESILRGSGYGENKFLIHGVTGSGKTEIYLQLIEENLEQGKDAIVLVPEISLTPQTLDRFVGRFGNQVAVYHSKLSCGEKYDEWRRMKSGAAKIVVGTRSAVFSPFKDLGLIIIDEEHETSYKSSMNPKYDAIEVAEKICDIRGANLVLGSATPSMKTYYRAVNKEIAMLKLERRVKDIPMPDVKLVDMKQELYMGNKSIFSRELYCDIINRMEKKEQVILFLNSRGFSKSVTCRSCGYVVKCDKCDISMTYHMREGKLVCHYCGRTRDLPNECPECKSKYIRHMGIGTERVETEARKLFPDARIARMDMDTMGRKGSYEETLGRMKNHEIDILIGTQMISKGLDFPDVTLVGVIIADIALNIPDFSASERTFQLITQVSGRAGRSDKPGKVLVQSYNPEHYSLQASKNASYDEFFAQEIKIRKVFNYPPFCELIDITVSSTAEAKAEAASSGLYQDMKSDIQKSELSKTELSKPIQAVLYRIKDRYRWKLIIKTVESEMEALRAIIERHCMTSKAYMKTDVRISVDINSKNMI